MIGNIREFLRNKIDFLLYYINLTKFKTTLMVVNFFFYVGIFYSFFKEFGVMINNIGNMLYSMPLLKEIEVIINYVKLVFFECGLVIFLNLFGIEITSINNSVVFFMKDILCNCIFSFGIRELGNVKIFENLNFGLIWIMILLIFKFIYDSVAFMNEIRDYVDLKYGEVFCEKYDYNTMLVSKRESVSHFNIFKLKKEEDFVLFSEEANKFLRKNDFEIKVDDSMGINIKNFIRRNREDLLPFLQWKFRESSFYGRDFFNEKKLCLSQDLLISEEKQLEVHCHKGSYYDTYLTNQICGKKLCSNKDNKIIADAMQFMPIDENKEGKKVFRSITDSMMNNEIGISTVGITRDNYIVLWKQNRRAQSSNDLLVPTGSGSCDWSDKKNLRFKETIERAMQRELLEESGIKKQSIKYGKSGKSIGETKVIGFFRWLTRGGKPEFVGITKLNVCYTALVENQKEVYIGKSYYFSTLDDLKNEVKKIFKEDNLSTPLYMNLKCIQSLLEEDNEELKNFLKIN